MIYKIIADTVTKISETSGTIQNISQADKVELSDSNTFTNSFILYPLQTYTFTKQIYAKLFDSGGLPVELRVVNFVGGISSSSSTSTVPSGVATDEQFNSMLDEILSGKASEDTISGEGGTVNINGEIHHVVSNNDFNSMLDDLGI